MYDRKGFRITDFDDDNKYEPPRYGITQIYINMHSACQIWTGDRYINMNQDIQGKSPCNVKHAIIQEYTK